eukprot:2520211-Rhodomonas_salina.6
MLRTVPEKSRVYVSIRRQDSLWARTVLRCARLYRTSRSACAGECSIAYSVPDIVKGPRRKLPIPVERLALVWEYLRRQTLSQYLTSRICCSIAPYSTSVLHAASLRLSLSVARYAISVPSAHHKGGDGGVVSGLATGSS